MTASTSPDNGDSFEQLIRVIAEYETINHHPSAHLAGIIGVVHVGSLQVNKELPPLPSDHEAAPLTSEVEILRRHPSFRPHKLRRQATRASSHHSTDTSLSINPPPSLGSLISASSDVETCSSILNSNFGTNTTNSFIDSPSPAGFTAEQDYSYTVEQVGTEQSWADPEPELTNVIDPSSRGFQIAPYNHVLLERKSSIESSSSLQTRQLISWDSDAPCSENHPLADSKPPRPHEASSVFDEDFDSSDSETSLVIEWKPLIPRPSTISSSKSDPRSSRKLRLPGASRPVPPRPPQFQVPPPLKHPPGSTAMKRKRTEQHSHPRSIDLISFDSDVRDYSNKRRSRDPHHLPRAFSRSLDDEAPSSLSPQPVYDINTVSAQKLPVEAIYPLRLTLEELFKGGTYTYRITARRLSGAPKIQEVQIDIKPGWKAGTRIIFPDAGNERYPGIFQTMVFVLEQVPHKRFTRLGGGKLEYDQNISHWDAREVNGTRAPRRVVGLDGKVIEFYPPRGAIRHGQETVIKGKGMQRRSKGKVVGRGDLIIRWNITP